MSQRQRRAALLAPSFVLVAATAMACGQTESNREDNAASAGRGGRSGGTYNPSAPVVGGEGPTLKACVEEDLKCPALAPEHGTACCALDLECSYDGSVCGSVLRCDGKAWVDESYSCNPPVPLPCPEDPPSAGSFCEEGEFEEYPEQCSYAVASCGELVAVCNVQVFPWVWEVSGDCVGGAAGADAGGAAGNDMGGAGPTEAGAGGDRP